MSNTLKNLLLILGVITVGYAGYYLYTMRSATSLNLGSDDIEFQAMLTRTQAFIQRSQELEAIQVDVSVLENRTFTSLTSYTTPLAEVDSGRTNPFAETTVTAR